MDITLFAKFTLFNNMNIGTFISQLHASHDMRIKLSQVKNKS